MNKPTYAELKAKIIEIMADLFFNFGIKLKLPDILKDK